MKCRAWLMGGLALAACRPVFDDDNALLRAPRVLAVKSEPAEAEPGTALSWTAFVAAPLLAPAVPAPTWRFCMAPKPLTESNVVSTACLDLDSLQAVGAGESIVASLPRDGCTLFGPDPPPGGFRPRDPDETGGYFQPLRVDWAGAPPVFHLARIACGVSGASAELATEFAQAYVPNQNPHLLPVQAFLNGATVTLDQIPRSASVELVAAWPAEDAESYAYFDRAAQRIVSRRESLTVSWYVSQGELETESNGRAEDELAHSVSNHWVADEASDARLWVVLRDSRGGADFAEFDLVVR